jgi:hypothetical protein
MRTIVSALLLASLAPAYAAGDEAPLFLDDDVLALRITAPIERLMEERTGEDLPGTVSWTADGGEVSAGAGVRTRGRFRGDPKNCSFAPLRLDFKKKDVADTLFEGQNKLKLVAHCRNGDRRYAQGVLREYLVYRMFNALTDRSFRVRLLDVTYVDSDSPDDERRAPAFLIEDDEQLAKRAGMERAEIPSTTIDALDSAFNNLVSMFEYFIGNTDFSPITGPPGETCCHNTILLRDSSGVLYPVPYDFDMSGMVDAPYASPDPRLHIDDVKSRVYRGRCRDNEHLPATIDTFVDARAKIEALVQGAPELSGKTRRNMLQYVGSFYSTIGDEARVRKLFVEACIK